MARNWKAKPTRVFVRANLMAFLLLIGIDVKADEVLLAQMSKTQQIELEVREPLKGSVDRPMVHLFEVVKVGDKQKIFERTPIRTTRRLVDGHLAVTLDINAPSANFDHFEVEVRDYESTMESTPQSFRATVAGITVTVFQAKNKAVDLRFKGSKDVDWRKFQTWITTAAVPAASVTIILPNSSVVAARVINASNLVARPAGDVTILAAEFNLDQSLPPNSKVKLTFGSSAFPPNPSAADLPLDLLRAAVGPTDVASVALPVGQERDKVRLNVLEAGGNYNTSIKLDPDPTTNEEPERKTEATFDLRVASPTSVFAEHDSRYATWTPAQLDAQVSNGKLTGDSISTNTIRAFTQIQQVFNTTDSGPISFFRLVGEGGINADRDLRTIEYTGLGDFRWNPGFLNRVVERDPPPDRGTTIRTEFIPIGVELGHRQVRRDPLFEADNFIRRLRFAAKFELLKPPFFEFSIEDRVWWRGEFAEHKFKNYFTTTFTYLPAGGRTNNSAGIFFSYERGSLPPFTTQRTSTLKAGFRVRRKSWRS